ncbi:helix-turn-helix domain-containing protein [Neisseria sp. Dent CA1/247]|uniref:helix-turn-helix domain-containing protein n=1 Tax=Neisseria sp. Dent CA1/247 TaxID=2912675 RepID=UPI001FD3B17E|nr:helix-turn-helix domain-containing protein [Neisseria sp. Dent CA1/247]UOO77953.1 helix-turn-helix domain-containing protein [Neisseria sp. Dent CA1/247]
MTPRKIINELKANGVSTAEIAQAANCTVHYINKIASGKRLSPSYQIVDKLRDFYKTKERR